MALRPGVLERRTPMRRTPFTAPRRPVKRARALPEIPTKRHPRPEGPSAATVLAVLARATDVDGYTRCEPCGTVIFGERGVEWSIHHRRGRDGKADSHSVANLLLVCGGDNVTGCHGRIHQRRSWSRPLGYWLSRTAGTDPLTVPVAIHGGDLRYLTVDGRYAHDADIAARAA